MERQPLKLLYGFKVWRIGLVFFLSLLLLFILFAGSQAPSNIQNRGDSEPVEININRDPVASNKTAGSPGPGWDGRLVIDPVVIKDGSLYKMWYTGEGLDWKWRIGYATSPDGISWTKYDGNPVLDVGLEGTWDSDVARVSVVLKSEGIYHMWYNGNGHSRFGYATSPDGINWTKYVDNPVFDLGLPGSWDENWVSLAGIIREAGLYKLWYTGQDSSGTGRIGFATSPDGINWTRHPSNPVLDIDPASNWDGSWVFDPYVIYDGGSYHMWYSGWTGAACDPNAFMRIGLASSPDGVTWIRSINNPVLDVSPGEWDYHGVTAPWVIFDGSLYHMWYHGGGWCAGDERIGYATSPDGITWTKYEGGPVLDVTRLVYLPAIIK